MIHLKEYKKIQSNSDWKEVYNKLERNFNFLDFKQALKFINEISIICEEEKHHPEINWIYNSYNNCGITINYRFYKINCRSNP